MTTPAVEIPALPGHPRPPRWLPGGLPVGLLVSWQAMLLLGLTALGQPLWVLITAGALVTATIAATGWRTGGRWPHQWVGLALRYGWRQRRPPPPPPPPPVAPGGLDPAPELALLASVTPIEAVTEVEIEDHVVAVLSHRHGRTAVLALQVDLTNPQRALLPLELVPLAEPPTPGVRLQLLIHSAPATPVRSWLAVHVRREPGYPDGELQLALTAAVRRLWRRLPTADDARPLDYPGLLAALRTLTRLDLASAETDPATCPGREQWRTWWTGQLPQRSLAVRSWPAQPGPPDAALLAALLQPECPLTCSLAVERRRLPTAAGGTRAGTEAFAVELTVRLAERHPAALDVATAEMWERMVATGAQVELLDGRQRPALAATLPLGGFLPGYGPAGSGAPPPRVATPTVATPTAPTPAVLAAPTVSVPTAPAAPTGDTGGEPAPDRAPQVVTVIVGQRRAAAGRVAAGLADALAGDGTDYPARLRTADAPVSPAAITEAGREHPVTLVELGRAAVGAPVLALSTRVLLVTGADRWSGRAAQRALAAVHEVDPALAAHAVIAVWCRTRRQYRRVAHGLAADENPRTAQIVPIPPHRRPGAAGLTALPAAAQEAYLRLRAALVAAADPGPATAAVIPLRTVHTATRDS